jgi:transposase InsO family protein
MGDLPDSRLDSGSLPFTRTAVDLFGPFEIGLARNRKTKRWGVLFTCMVTRAVFLEIVPSFSTSDFLLALRKFISLYRKPELIHSDNGTNFVGAERELRGAVEEMYASQAIPDFMKRVSIKWTFQPPRTPHFGGVHESLVRSTKKALYNALEQEKNSFRHPT